MKNSLSPVSGSPQGKARSPGPLESLILSVSLSVCLPPSSGPRALGRISLIYPKSRSWGKTQLSHSRGHITGAIQGSMAAICIDPQALD